MPARVGFRQAAPVLHRLLRTTRAALPTISDPRTQAQFQEPKSALERNISRTPAKCTGDTRGLQLAGSHESLHPADSSPIGTPVAIVRKMSGLRSTRARRYIQSVLCGPSRTTFVPNSPCVRCRSGWADFAGAAGRGGSDVSRSFSGVGLVIPLSGFNASPLDRNRSSNPRDLTHGIERPIERTIVLRGRTLGAILWPPIVGGILPGTCPPKSDVPAGSL